MSDDDAEADSEVEDGDEEGPPAPGDMQRGLFRDFLDWKGLVLIEPTALTHNPDEFKPSVLHTVRCAMNGNWIKSCVMALLIDFLNYHSLKSPYSATIR